MLLNEKRETYFGDVVGDANTYYNQNIDDKMNEETIPDVTAFKDKETGHFVVTIGDNVFEMDEYATAPNGVNTFVGTKTELTEDLGEPVDVEALPESVKEAILERMKGKVEEGESKLVTNGSKYMAEEIFYAPKKAEKKVAEPKEKIEENSMVIEGTKWL